MAKNWEEIRKTRLQQQREARNQSKATPLLSIAMDDIPAKPEIIPVLENQHTLTPQLVETRDTEPLPERLTLRDIPKLLRLLEEGQSLQTKLQEEQTEPKNLGPEGKGR